MATITCVDCGAIRTRCPSNTRFCKDCRVLRDISYFTEAGRKCGEPGCSTKFAPLHRQDFFCPKHAAVNEYVRGDCNFCHREDVPVPWAGKKVCVDCVREGKHRAKVLRALHIYQDRRRDENGWRKP